MQGYNAGNVENTRRYLDRFISHVDAEGRDILCAERNTPSSVDHGCLLRWLQAVRQKGLKESSVQQQKSAVSGFYKWLIRVGKMTHNPVEMLAAIRLPEYVPKPLGVKETEKILDLASKRDVRFHLRDQAMLEVFYASGVRRRELLNIDVQDLCLEEAQPYFRIRQGKGKRDGVGMLNEAAVAAIKAYLPERAELARRWERPADWAPLFLGKSGKRLDYWTVGLIVKAVGKDAIGKHVTPHQFRHSFCTDLLNRGADLKSIQELARHKHLNTTERYLAVSRERLMEQYKKHPRK